MANTISVDTKTIQTILARLDKITQELNAIKAKIFEEEPPYGSDAWWEWSDKKAIQEIKAGKGTVVHNKQELDEFFKNL